MASTSFTSKDLSGLLPNADLNSFPGEDLSMIPDHPPLLRTLNLNRTKVDDDAAVYIAACTDLEVLELEGTKITGKV